MPDILHFLLVPDKASGRCVRRALVSDGARRGTVVGTWGELVDQANRAYLFLPPATDWEPLLADAARKLSDAFWSESLKADPERTVPAIGRELRRALEALGPDKELRPAGKSRLSDRGKRHLGDLARLHDAMGRVLPEGLAAVRALLDADRSEAVRLVAVHRNDGFPVLSPWQEALLAKLASDCGDSARDAALDAVLAGSLDPAPAGKAKSALRHLQEKLFVPSAPQGKLDDTLTCLAVRDDLEGAEVAAGMAQKALAADAGLKTSDIGLLLPADGSCDRAIREVFAKAGLPLSGLEDPSGLRNLGGETVFHFLATRRRPAPSMALAALYASPLMPWDEATGNRLAMKIMGGRYDPEPPEGLSADGRRMMKLVRGEQETPGSLREALKAFAALLTRDDSRTVHVEIARDAVDILMDAIGKIPGKDVPWEALRSLVPQAPVPLGTPTELTLEGAAVFREDEEPWRLVRLLYILGFSDGSYPAGPGRSPVFDAADAEVLKNDLGYSVETADERMAGRRCLFLRQLRAVGDRAVFLAPLRDAMGVGVALCGTTAFMARLFEGIRAPEDLFLTLERESDREMVRGLALAPPSVPVPPMTGEIRDPELSADLLTDGTGELRHVSPSGLETLMVSPLAWFLDRLRISPLAWAPDTLDPATKGTLAHQVFETLFPAGASFPTDARIKSSVERLLNDAILQIAPFLLGSEWYVERRNLMKDIETAALRWREILERTGATILGVETKLEGTFEGLPIRGRTDLLLALPSGRLFVVDYKKSSSTARRTSMEEGYDLQTSLYREMLRTGKVSGAEGEALAKALKAGAEIGVLYYMMDDQRALADTTGWLPRTVSGVQELGGGISIQAEALVKECLRAVRAGKIPLNRENDEEDFREVGVKTYALENSPLIAKFMLPALVEEEGE